MRILLFGKNGQIGRSLLHLLPTLGEVFACGREEVQFEKIAAIQSIIRVVNPELIINAAAYTQVDKAEIEQEKTWMINAKAPEVLAIEAKKINAKLIHFSTDYIFDGCKATPYTEEDKPNPINFYGKSKWVAERAIQNSGCDYLIFRLSWVYSDVGSNLLKSILKLFAYGEPVSMVDDQIAVPTTASFIAGVVSEYVARRLPWNHIYNLVPAGKTSRYGFAKKIANLLSQPVILQAITTDQYSAQACRPSYSVLNHSKLQKILMVKWMPWETFLPVELSKLYSQYFSLDQNRVELQGISQEDENLRYSYWT